MTDSLDALGGLVDAGLVAKALGRKGKAGINAAEVADAHHECANCGQYLLGNFCANCGQQAHVHRSLAHVGEEFLHGITHFDGKAWQTLPMLVFRPGRLTREYIMGKRARYIAPVPLFLLVVFLMFFVFSFVHTPSIMDNGKPLTPTESRATVADIDNSLVDIDRELATARAANKTSDIAALTTSRTALLWGRRQAIEHAQSYSDRMLANPDAILADLKDNFDKGEIKVDLGNKTVDERVREALHNPQLALYKIQGKVYKFSFLLVPLSLPWLWLMFAFRRNVRMYDHAVFALYSISFMSLLFIVGSIGVVIGVTSGLFWSLLIWVAPLAHMFAQLKGAYALGKFGAAWRTIGLALASVISLSIYLSLMVVIGLVE